MKSSGGAEGGQARWGGVVRRLCTDFLLLLLFRVGHNLATEQRQQFFFFCPRHKAWGILVLPPGIEPAPLLRWKNGILTTGQPGKSPHSPLNEVFKDK